MGSIGVNGKMDTDDGHKGCRLFMDYENGGYVYNNGFCLFPLVGGAVICGITFIFLILWGLIMFRSGGAANRVFMIVFLTFGIMMAMLSFAMCAEIGIGLTKGCKVLPDDMRHNCRHRGGWNALWAAEICSGLSGGFLIIAVAMGALQYMTQMSPTQNTISPAQSQTEKFSQIPA
ncbi:hypothetical protein BGZ76_010323 [Entomortierella beljakovae]|nr:hypothetical protein BGZ76_010323 [Entomortierella beljakovae]